jgi:hypothetical protein
MKIKKIETKVRQLADWKFVERMELEYWKDGFKKSLSKVICSIYGYAVFE